MIEVKGITKIYGTQKALSDVSFSAGAGEIVGFLGPNGAGKSTMMKILTCYIPPTSGTASVSGHDINTDSLAVRRNVGYLPEHNPLYLDMYVKEFLTFTGNIYKVRNVRSRVNEMIGLTGLAKEQQKKIGALSKGYRQRVGLAQAMIHDPKVLIMDEPTTGLDPNQIEEIRSLIRSLGREKTVMLSTHIMQEVEAICDKVVIVHNGRIVADDRTKNLRRGGVVQVVTVEFDGPATREQMLAITGVERALHVRGNTWRLNSSVQEDLRKEVFAFAVASKLAVLTLTREEQKMEDVFRDLTRRDPS